jgi:hypothetical protein
MAAKKGAAPVADSGLGGMDDNVAQLSKGSRVWYRQDATTWVLAEMRDAPSAPPPPADGKAPKKGAAAPPNVAPITLLSGPTAGKPVDAVPVTSLMPANPEMQASISDMTQLSYLNEPSILGNLQLRYSKDAIYTCAGPVLIALNPCKELPLYSEEVQHDYKGGQQAGGRAGAKAAASPVAADCHSGFWALRGGGGRRGFRQLRHCVWAWKRLAGPRRVAGYA